MAFFVFQALRSNPRCWAALLEGLSCNGHLVSNALVGGSSGRFKLSKSLATKLGDP